MRGKLVSIEGLDGAGKTLLVEGLVEKLRERGCQVRVHPRAGRFSLFQSRSGDCCSTPR